MKTLLDQPPACQPPAAQASPAGAMLLRSWTSCLAHKFPASSCMATKTTPKMCLATWTCSFQPNSFQTNSPRRFTMLGTRSAPKWCSGSPTAPISSCLAGMGDNGFPVLLQLHVSSRYEMAGRVFFEADEIILGCRRKQGFFVPAAEIEFACILANRLCKADLTDEHGRRLSALYAMRPLPCNTRVSRLLSPRATELVSKAARDGDWSPIQRSIKSLRRNLLASRSAKPPGQLFRRMIRKAARWILPRNGFHVVFLGPDGVGKSTTIETFQRDLALAFLSTIYLTFAPGLLPQKFAPPKPDGPHSLPPRSLSASLLKAAWWLVCYTVGYCVTIRPTLARAGLVVNHRYLVDAIVDQKRYRYSGPVWLLKCIWAVAQKPNLVILLDAAPEVIQSRKQEVPFEETVRQVQAYRTAIAALPIGKIVDASQPRAKVASDVEWLVLDLLAQRALRRMKLEASNEFFRRFPSHAAAGDDLDAPVSVAGNVRLHRAPQWFAEQIATHFPPMAEAPDADAKIPRVKIAWRDARVAGHPGVRWHCRLQLPQVSRRLASGEWLFVHSAFCGNSKSRNRPLVRSAGFARHIGGGIVALYAVAPLGQAEVRRRAAGDARPTAALVSRSRLDCPAQAPADGSGVNPLLRRRNIRWAFSSGAPVGARNRKASALVLDSEGGMLAFAKIARSDIARKIAVREADVLDRLAQSRRWAIRRRG